MTVLCSLVVAMTLSAGLLLLLEPGPMVVTQVPLAAIEDVPAEANQPNLIPADIDVQRWSAIVIHDSRSASGSLNSIDQLHRQLGLDDGAYHFVIGNGQGAADGEIQVASRWSDQRNGAHTLGDDQTSRWYNQNAIGICVIGDGRRSGPTAAQMAELTRLVRRLQATYRIAADQVKVQYGNDTGGVTGLHFPTAGFFAQLER